MWLHIDCRLLEELLNFVPNAHISKPVQASVTLRRDLLLLWEKCILLQSAQVHDEIRIEHKLYILQITMPILNFDLVRALESLFQFHS